MNNFAQENQALNTVLEDTKTNIESNKALSKVAQALKEHFSRYDDLFRTQVNFDSKLPQRNDL